MAEAAIDKALALSDLGPQQIQRATIVKSNCCYVGPPRARHVGEQD